MNCDEAKKVAEQMTYRQAVQNCLYARCVPYKKATKIKLLELLDVVEKMENNLTDNHKEI